MKATTLALTTALGLTGCAGSSRTGAVSAASPPESAMTTLTLAPVADAPWSVEGEWVDACNCAIPCPCWDSKMPTMGHCSEFYFFHVNKGHYGKTSLDGLEVVHVSQTAHGKTMDQSIADRDVSIANLYVPTSISDETAAAVDKVFSRFAFSLDGSTKKHAVKKTAMKVTFDADKLDVDIPGVLTARIKVVKDDAGKPKPFPADTSSVGFLGKGTQGVSLAFEFHDDGLDWKHHDGNATWAPFSYSSDRGPLPWEPGYAPPPQK